MRSYWPANLRGSSIGIRIKNREWIYGFLLVAAVGILSVALTLQGWRSRAPAFDLLTYIYSIRNFVATGVLPVHGDTGSYGSYKPPGTAWLMLPSTLLFADPRLSEYVGTAFLHFSTLLGLFLLGRRFFGLRCASLAVLMYGLSENGIFFAGSLWPNGRPDFYIWIVFFASLWVLRREARYLAVAMAIWAVGMYVDMGITPAFFLFPALWLYFRPPVQIKPLLVAAAIVLVIWSPYLRFEVTRGFADIRSQLLQQSIHPANYQSTWCDPSLTPHYLGENSNVSHSAVNGSFNPSSFLSKFIALVGNAWEKTISNFRAIAPIPGASAELLILTLGSLLFLSGPRSSGERTKSFPQTFFHKDRLTLFAIGMVLCGFLFSKFFLSQVLIHASGLRPILVQLYKLQKILLFGGIALLGIPRGVMVTDHILRRTGISIQTAERAEKIRILILSLLIPWSILVLLAEPGKPERFMWLWPLQLLFLAAFLTDILPKLSIPPWIMRVGQVAIPLVVIGNLFLVSRVASWIEAGWAGPDAEEVQVVDYVARQIKAEGKDRAAIGYQTFIYPFMANYNITNPVYKVGAEYDIFFWYRHGITNTDRCAEGFKADDEYRIVQTAPKSPDWAPRNYFDVPADKQFRFLAQVSPYQVFTRDGTP